MTEMERELAIAIDDGLKEDGANAVFPPLVAPVANGAKHDPVPLRAAVPRPQTIADQVQQLERIEREIANRLRHEGVAAQCDVERKVTDAHAFYARQLAEETARIERERDEMIRQATDEYHKKLHDLAALLRRRQ
jgi:hypothetical protein